MATVYEADGAARTIEPQETEAFTERELCDILGTDRLWFVHMRDGRVAAYCKEAHLTDERFNVLGQQLLGASISPNSRVRGPLIVFQRPEIEHLLKSDGE